MKQEFIDVLTPPIVENPGMETHIHPFEVMSKIHSKATNRYLHTSPEFAMKKLISLKEEELDKIFQISYCFRDEPSSEIHRNQFLMLEWYRKNERYEKIMDDCEALITWCLKYLMKKSLPVKFNKINFTKMTIQELFQKTIQIDILNYLKPSDLRKLISTKFKDVPLPATDLNWDDYFFLLFLNKVEPELKNYPALILYEYPAPLAALSTLKASDKRVCERFEIYLKGVEIANAFNELTEEKEQKMRFTQQALEKEKAYKYKLPEPTEFYQTLERGLPKCSGIALGVERLLAALIKTPNPFFD